MNTKNSNNLNHTKGKAILRFLLCVLPIAIIGGYFTGIYTLEHSTSEVTAQILAQIKSPTAFYMLTTLQSMIYTIIASVAGYFLADRIGLLKPFAFKKDILKKTVPVIILFGILFTADYFVIGPFIPEVAADYERGISGSDFCKKNRENGASGLDFHCCEYHRGAPVCGRASSCDHGIFRTHYTADSGEMFRIKWWICAFIR